MVKSKGWNWKMLNDETKKDIWLNPSIESYYLVDRWKKQGKSKFLDIGCGLGRHTIQFSKAGFNTKAIDISKDAVEYAKKWAQKENLDIEFLNIDMMNLPYKKESFDCVLCRNVISHTDTEGMKCILDKIYDLLENNGECFLTLGSKNASTYKDPKNPILDKNTKIRMDDGPEKGVPHFYADIDIIPELFKKFKIELLYQNQEFKQKEDGSLNSYWHYFLLIRK